VVGRTQSLDAIPAALQELSSVEQEQWNSTQSYDATIAFLRGDLSAISTTYEQFKPGFPASMPFIVRVISRTTSIQCA
jgi:hypothetical protein